MHINNESRRYRGAADARSARLQGLASRRYRFAARVFASVMAALCTTARADYQIGPGDLLRISVFGAPELSNDVRVSASGAITFPLIGQLSVGGRSPAQVEAMVSAGLVEGGFLRHAQTSVLVVEYQSQKVAVLGHVMKPGQYPLQAAAKALDVLAAAGGLAHDKAADRATLIRASGERIEIDLIALFGGDPAQNVAVAGGDSLYIPKAPQFYVYGEVQKPGLYRLERNMTVSRAISAGGGLTPRGSERRVVVKRRNANGEEQTFAVRGSDLLQPDDVLMVKEGWF